MPGFSSPPDPKLFNAQVWEIVRQVPPGYVTTYGQVASILPPPGGLNQPDYEAFAARWVGGAMAVCPEGVPWQRVINAQGKISARPGAAMQRSLLEAEGVVFDDKGRTDLNVYGWAGPDAAWLKERGYFKPKPLGKAVQGKLNI